MSMTPPSWDNILPEDPGDTYADSAYQGSRPETAVRARGGTPRVVALGRRNSATSAIGSKRCGGDLWRLVRVL